jgi:four helix bundle protein
VKYERFAELPVWKAAIGLAIETYALTGKPLFGGQSSLRDQIQRATVSISNNIAEGFERGTTQELVTFLYIARGSAREVRSMLCLLERLPAFSDLKSEISDLKSTAEGISRQLRLGRIHCRTPKSKASVTRRQRQDTLNPNSKVGNRKTS